MGWPLCFFSGKVGVMTVFFFYGLLGKPGCFAFVYGKGVVLVCFMRRGLLIDRFVFLTRRIYYD